MLCNYVLIKVSLIMIKIVKNNNKNYPGASTIFIYLTLKTTFGFDLWQWNLLKTIFSFDLTGSVKILSLLVKKYDFLISSS
jgi:hypothetical protein